MKKPVKKIKKSNVGLSKAQASRANGAKGGRPKSEVNVDGDVDFAGSMAAAEKLWKIPRHILQWAKGQGSPAFHGSRVHRIIKEWLTKNPYPEKSPYPTVEGALGLPEIVMDGDYLPDKNTLERIKLKKQIRNIDLEHDREAGTLAPKAETKETWTKAMEAIMSTTQSFLGKDEYNAWARQVKSALKGLDL